jgi:hypothetical protein
VGIWFLIAAQWILLMAGVYAAEIALRRRLQR